MFDASISSPPALIGGESPQKAKRRENHGAVVDWLTLTFQPEPEIAIEMEVLDFLRAYLDSCLVFVECPAMFGYENAVRFYVNIDGTHCHVGRFDWGGNHHKGRARLDISGTGCARVYHWQQLMQYIANNFFDLKLTRVDLAVDFLNGEYTVDDAKEWYQQGDFHAGGRIPKHSLIGAWLTDEPEAGDGRTLLIGKRGNGKMLRAYEKGRQLGDPQSRWTRFEVEFRNKDRDLPLDILTDCDKYFAGAYKALEGIIDAASERIKTHQKEEQISLDHLVHWARQSYGKVINVIRLSMNETEVIDTLTVNGVPTRLEKAAVNSYPRKKTFSGKEKPHETHCTRLPN